MVEVSLPKLGLTMDEGTIVAWLKAEGDDIQEGEPLIEVETDKVVMEVEATDSGVLRRILVEQGSTVPVGQIIALIGSADEEIPASYAAGALANASAPAATPASAKAAPAPKSEPKTAGAPGKRAAASPAARRLARELSVDLAGVVGTGPGGRIVDADIRSAAEQAASAPPAPATAGAAATGDQEVIPLTPIQRTAGVRLQESFRDVPHFYLNVEARADRLQARRQVLLATVEQETGVRLSFTDMFIEYIARALRQHPRANATWRDGEARVNAHVNVCLAMDTDDGLVVPVIHQADTLTIAEIAKRRAELTGQAKSRKLPLASMQGGTFTLTNLGSFGIDSFTPIINPPQAAILGTGRIADRAIVVGGMLALMPTVMISLSADHRVLDGVAAARFLHDIQEMVEQA